MTSDQGGKARLSFGLMISSDEPPGRDRRQVAEEHLERAVVAQRSGIGIIAAGHRYSFLPAGADAKVPATTWRLQPLPLLTHVAGTLGNSVNYCTAILLSTSCHPVQLLEDAATVNALCGGRFRLGLGLGWIPDEFAAFGVDYDTRVERFEELIRAYRQLGQAGTSSFQGRHFSWRSAEILARGADHDLPALWIGGSVGAAVRRAARMGDAWVMSSHIDIETLRRQKSMYDATRQEAGLSAPRDVPLVRTLILNEDRAQAWTVARPELQSWYKQRQGMGWAPSGDSQGDIEGLAAGRWIVGDPDDAVAEIQRLREVVGVTEIIFTANWPGLDHKQRLKMLDLLRTDVFPRVTQQ